MNLTPMQDAAMAVDEDAALQQALLLSTQGDVTCWTKTLSSWRVVGPYPKKIRGVETWKLVAPPEWKRSFLFR